MVRHPKLLAAADGVFGSSWDSAIVAPNCKDTLPPVPQFTGLADRIESLWPSCPDAGTIRFTYYRTFYSAVDAALLATEADLKGKKPDAPMPQRKGISPAQVNAAIAGLSDYYQRYGRASAVKAPLLARAMVRDIMGTWNTCDDLVICASEDEC